VGLIDRLRDRISELSIRSTFIVGFPGETEQAFQNLYDTLEQVKLDRVGVFSYSYEEDTTSSKLPNHISEDVKELRREKIMKLQEKISEEKLSMRIGKTYDVLIEDEVYSENKNELPYFLARSQFEAPDVDGNIILKERNLEVGSMYKAEILTAYEHDMIGRTTQS
jgi:ribosomal protein S12 methylthiotransferase